MNIQNNSDEYTEILSRQEEEPVNENLGRRAEETYCYMNADHYKAQMNISLKNRKKGAELVQKGWVTLDDVQDGYLRDTRELVCDFTGTGTEEYAGKITKFPIRILVDRDHVLQVNCSCSRCYGGYYYFRQKTK